MLLPANQLVFPSIKWLWPGYLPLGHLVLLDGDPALGKSLITLDLAARITTGRPFPMPGDHLSPTPEPAGQPLPTAPDEPRAPRPVLLICAEDTPGIILQRLRDAGADLALTYLWPADNDLRLPTDLPRLQSALESIRPGLVVFDPILAFLDHRMALGNEISLRPALKQLAQLADRSNCTFLMLRHLSKRSSQHCLYRGTGSIAFIAAARSALLAAPSPTDPGQRLLAQTKNNYAPLQPTLVYSLTAVSPSPCLAVSAWPLTWLGSTTLTAADLGSPRSRPRLDRARSFLLDFLQSGPRPTCEIHSAARARHISKATLRRAKELLGIRCHRLAQHNGRIVPHLTLPFSQPDTTFGSEPLDEWLRRLDHPFYKQVNELPGDPAILQGNLDAGNPNS